MRFRSLGRRLWNPGGGSTRQLIRANADALRRLELEHNHRIWTLEMANLIDRLAVLEEMVYRHGVEHNDRITELEQATASLATRLPDVLHAIESTHGNARLVRRELQALSTEMSARLDAVEATAARLRAELHAFGQRTSAEHVASS